LPVEGSRFEWEDDVVEEDEEEVAEAEAVTVVVEVPSADGSVLVFSPPTVANIQNTMRTDINNSNSNNLPPLDRNISPIA
jgi:hypothetical protein